MRLSSTLVGAIRQWLVSRSALAREFNVARKTIQRDLKDLSARGQIDPEVEDEGNSQADSARLAGAGAGVFSNN